MDIKCKYVRRLYPKDENADMSFCIVAYRADGEIKELGDNRFCAKGAFLPCGKGTYTLHGEIKKDPKYGLQFVVSSYDIEIGEGKDNIVSYLSSGQIKGIGPVLAERIYDTFGDTALDVLDEDIDRLRELPGVGEKKLEKIKESYLANRGAKEILSLLLPFKITVNKILKFYKRYGTKTLKTVKEHPFSLVEIKGIGFRIADDVARKVGFDPMGEERIDAALKYALEEAMMSGHMCLPSGTTAANAKNLLDNDEIDVPRRLIDDRIQTLINTGGLCQYNKFLYLPVNNITEDLLARRILKKRKETVKLVCKNLENEIAWEEKALGFQLAPEQKKAVLTALCNPITVITGGPGTGKTSVLRAIVDIFVYQFPKAEVTCCAPTGKAARRMSESTGFPASTIHSALGLMADDDGGEMEAHKMLPGDLVIVDEVSMLDSFLANQLMKSVKPGAVLVLVGDKDQLPSVAAGAVLHDIIKSDTVPVVMLKTVFRQQAGSRIAVNAALINHGTPSLEYGDDFRFIKADTATEAQPIVVEEYLKAVNEVGVDNVAFLCPLRSKTDTGVNIINPILRDAVNPPEEGKPEIRRGYTTFRKGDKVMQTRNNRNVSNGDIGFITDILVQDGEKIVVVEFGDGRVKEYDTSELEMLTLAYAITIHKSQGSEYHTCIINVQWSQFMLLNRSLIYTGITRAKKKAVIIGETKALVSAIRKENDSTRYTGLVQRLTAK